MVQEILFVHDLKKEVTVQKEWQLGVTCPGGTTGCSKEVGKCLSREEISVEGVDISQVV